MDVIKGLDRDGPTSVVIDDLNILQYQIVCRATASSSNVFRLLNIQIQDQNDNAPQFVGAPYRFNVNELTPVGVTVYRLISTNDLDEGDNKQVEYFFERSPTAQFDGTSYFELPSVQEGLVAVRRALDFEPMYRATNGDAALTFYNLTLFARDKGIPAQTSSTYMVITITDGDDLGPEFQYSTCLPSQIADGKSCVRPDYRSTIESDSNQGSTLVFTPVPVDPNNPTATTEIIIQDRDSLNNGVRCQVVSTVPAGYQDRFLAVSSRISGSEKQHRCTIFHLSNQAISHSAVPQLDLILLIQELSDQGRIDYATVQVSVIQANNFDPVLAASSNTGWVLENSPTAMLGLTLVHAWVCGCVFLV